MSGMRNRIEAYVELAWDYFTRSPGSQILDRSDAARIDWGEDEDDDEEAEARQEDKS